MDQHRDGDGRSVKTNFTGTIHFDDKDVTRSSVEFKAKTESIDTGVEARDKHLRQTSSKWRNIRS